MHEQANEDMNAALRTTFQFDHTFFGRQFSILDTHGNLTGRNLELEGHIFGTDDGDRYADGVPVRSVGA